MTHATDRDSIGAWLESCVREGWMPSAAWYVGDARGAISRGATGLRQAEPSPRRAQPSTVYDLASLTKPLATATLLVLMEGRGRLSLDDAVGAHLPQLRGSAWERRTLLELAAHLSGLPAWAPLYLDAADLDGYLQAIAVLEPAGPRGAALYSDLGYLLLGAVLEAVAGEPLDRLFRRLVAEPSGLRRTGYVRRPARVEAAAATERGNEFERRMAAPRGAEHAWRTELIRGQVHDANAWGLRGVAGHAGLFGDVEDVANLGRRILTGGEPLGTLVRDRLSTRVAGSPRTVGMVVAAGSSAARGVLPAGAVGHTGFTGTSLWLDPAAGRVYVLLTNRVHPAVPERDFQDLRAEFHRRASTIRADR